MNEFHQEDVTPDAADDTASTDLQPELVSELDPILIEPVETAESVAAAEPVTPSGSALSEPVEPVAVAEVQESMTFDEIVATAAAGASPPAAEAPAAEPAAEPDAETTPDGAQGSNDLDDMVAALKDGSVASVAAAAADEGSDKPVAQDADAALETVGDDVLAEEILSENEAYEEIEDVYAGPALARNGLGARLPAWIYAGVWVVFAGAMVYLLWPAATKPFVGLPYYAYMVIGGLALTVTGPIMALVTWLVTRMSTTASERLGLARAVWTRCMLATVFGVAVWWLALYALDLHRSGVIR